MSVPEYGVKYVKVAGLKRQSIVIGFIELLGI
jgi:hypothetical protein